jgi:hypothetical protein
MSVENPQSPVVQLFQRAHQQMVLLSRVDEQLQQLTARRKTLLDELRDVQYQINEEFERLMESQGDMASRMAAISARIESATGSPAAGSNGNIPFASQRVDEHAAV